MVSGIRTLAEELSQAIDYIEDEDFESALPLLARVVSFHPGNQEAYELWIQCYVSLGRLEKVLELVEAGLAAGVEPAPLLAHRSEALRRADRVEEAVEAARRAVELDPELTFAIRALALAESARGADEAALGIYQEAVARIPDDEDLYFAFIDLAAALEKYELAIESARHFLRHFGRDAEVLAILGDSYLAQRDYRRADRAYRDAADLKPDEVGHHVMILFVALLRQDQAAYDAYAQQLEEDDPELAELTMREISLLLERSGADRKEE